MRRVVLRLPTCTFYQASSQPGSRCSYHPCHCQYLLGSRLPRPCFLPRPSPSPCPSSASLPGTLNDILTLVFVYTLVGIFALLLLASLVYFALRCLDVTARSEATADSGLLEVEARLLSFSCDCASRDFCHLHFCKISKSYISFKSS